MIHPAMYTLSNYVFRLNASMTPLGLYKDFGAFLSEMARLALVMMIVETVIIGACL